MNFEDELLQDAQEDAFIVSHIQRALPEDVRTRLAEEDLYYILDVAEDYFAESGVLEAEADDEGFVDVDLDAAARYVAEKAKAEKQGSYSLDDLVLVIEAQLSYGEEIEAQ
ncbi:MAG: hypothetical protein J6M53_07980 [Bacteroidaceae bacterium]|nr:hypothetical protein [Bacteroidaceae bacterium]